MAEEPNKERKEDSEREGLSKIDPTMPGPVEGDNGNQGAAEKPKPQNRESDFKNLRSLMLIAGIGGPFSFLIGGVVLSTIALICAVIGFTIFKRLYSGSQSLENSDRIKRAIIFSIIISTGALVWNIGWLVMVMPEVLQMIQNNDFSSLYNGSAGVPDSGSEKTIWD